MNKLSLLICSAVCGSMATAASAKKVERPNILWLTFEDTSAYEFGCYGNKDVSTPNTDELASKGIQFMNAWSVAPQSSPARSSLITGCYAPTWGMDFHPVSFDTPQDIFFPQRLREAGYYCVNNSKTHYNSTNNNSACWDECTRTASYNSSNRKEGQPFFAVFNTATCHMGRVRTIHTDGRRDYTKEGIYTYNLALPPHVPDLPEVRSDYAGHLESVQDVDKWLGVFLKDLKDKGLDENTIIFFFSDHGGCLPRGKGYLYETGLRVPLIVYFPKKWEHLANGMKGQDKTLVNFTDLGPTVLSLAGVKPTKVMQGKPIFGKYRYEGEREMQFAFASNQLHHFMPVRAVTDGKYKYIRSYMPYRQFALRNYYQWGMPSNKAWDAFVLGGHNTNPDWDQPFHEHPAEMLFDLDKDPFELHNIADQAENKEILAKMREAVSEHIRSTKDLGFFMPTCRRNVVLYDKVRKNKYPLDALYDLIEAAGLADAGYLNMFHEALQSNLREMRFWASVGYAQLARQKKISDCPKELLALLKDEDPYVAAEAAYAVTYLGHDREGISRLINPVVEADRKIGYSSLECISLDEEMRDKIRPFLPELKYAAENLPRKANEDAGPMARGILVNLGEMDIKYLHGEDKYSMGLKLNHGRRAMVPLPF